MFLSFVFSSPSSNLNNKKITSQDDLGNMAVQQTNSLPGLPSTGTSRTANCGLRDDTSIASGSSGFGSLTKKKAADMLSGEMDPISLISSIVTDSGISESSEPNTMTDLLSTSGNNQLSQQQANLVQTQQPSTLTQSAVEQGHSRNSSNTSQVCINFYYTIIFELFLFFN